jgi:putative ABC transport system permease protein
MSPRIPRSPEMAVLRVVFRTIAKQKMRTALAMLGVFLGSFMLTLVLHLSASLGIKVDEETQRLGSNIVEASAGRYFFPRGGVNRAGGNKAATFSLGDVVAVRQSLAGAKSVVPYTLGSLRMSYGRNVTTRPVVATNSFFPGVRHIALAHGRFFSEQEYIKEEKVCVIGYEVAQILFPISRDAVGKLLKLNNTSLLIVGVMEEKGQDASGINVDEQVYVPLSTYIRRIVKQDHISGVWIQASSRLVKQETLQSTQQLLRTRRHLPVRIPDDFTVSISEQANAMQEQALELVVTLGALGASISFAIGTLGIFSMMTLIVRSRMVEIGLRRAVGATRGDIIRQFLLESMFLAGGGGIAGIILALLLLSLPYAAGALPLYYSPNTSGLVFGASLGCGLFAGLHPAIKAVNIDILHVLKM